MMVFIMHNVGINYIITFSMKAQIYLKGLNFVNETNMKSSKKPYSCSSGQNKGRYSLCIAPKDI